MSQLTEHGSLSRHLPEQPLQHLVLGRRVLGQELTGLLRQVQEDGTTLEDVNRLSIGAVRVYKGRNLVVGLSTENALVSSATQGGGRWGKTREKGNTRGLVRRRVARPRFHSWIVALGVAIGMQITHTNLQKLLSELLALANIDGVSLVRQAGLLEESADLLAAVKSRISSRLDELQQQE